MKLLALFITVVTLSVSACRSSSADYQEKLEKVSTSELRSITDDQGYIIRAKEASEESSFFEVCLKKEGSVEVQEGSCVPAFKSYDGKPVIFYNQTMKEHLLKEKKDALFTTKHSGKALFGMVGALVGGVLGETFCPNAPGNPVVSSVLTGVCWSLFISAAAGPLALVGAKIDEESHPVDYPILWRIPKAQKAALTSYAFDEDPHKVKSVSAALRGIGSYLKNNLTEAKYLHQFCIPKVADPSKEICRTL